METIVLALALLGAEPSTGPSPCDGPPSVLCEKFLAEAALHWEERYHIERLAHLDTIKVCSVMAVDEDTEKPKLWVYITAIAASVAVGAGGALLVHGLVN